MSSGGQYIALFRCSDKLTGTSQLMATIKSFSLFFATISYPFHFQAAFDPIVLVSCRLKSETTLPHCSADNAGFSCEQLTVPPPGILFFPRGKNGVSYRSCYVEFKIQLLEMRWGNVYIRLSR